MMVAVSRPKSPDARTVTIATRVSAADAEAVDGRLGGLTRSDWLLALVERELGRAPEIVQEPCRGQRDRSPGRGPQGRSGAHRDARGPVSAPGRHVPLVVGHGGADVAPGTGLFQAPGEALRVTSEVPAARDRPGKADLSRRR